MTKYLIILYVRHNAAAVVWMARQIGFVKMLLCGIGAAAPYYSPICATHVHIKMCIYHIRKSSFIPYVFGIIYDCLCTDIQGRAAN